MVRFINNNDGVVSDMLTGLMWQQDAGIQLTFWKAQEYATSLRLTGYDNWRLPTIEELRMLIDYNRKDPAIDSVFECRSDYYQSSTLVVTKSFNVWYVNFYYGYVYWGSGNNSYSVRCVRDFKKES